MIRNTAESGEEIFNRYVESELRLAINQSLDKLPPRCREIFKLSRFEGKSNQEIASQLGISKRTVELQVSNALSLLRQELKGFLPGCLIALFMG
jgi:RNA polymerase sigma-70 factor (ECF subfamily)